LFKKDKKEELLALRAFTRPLLGRDDDVGRGRLDN
jgi:hypothetical protein